jgi:hypothetical protein
MTNEVVGNLAVQKEAITGASGAKGLSERGRALEEKYFRDRNAELLANLKTEVAKEAPVAPAPAAEPAGEDKVRPGSLADNAHSDRTLEEYYFHQRDREAIEAMRAKDKTNKKR